jgi:hypothetical protein
MTSNFGLTAHQAQRKALVNLALGQKPKTIPTQTPVPKPSVSVLSGFDQSHYVANKELLNVNDLSTIPSARKSAGIASTTNKKSAL